MEEIPQSLLVNPGGKVPQRMHFGIPFLSHLHLHGGSSGVTIYDIFGNTGEDINEKIRRKIFEMKDRDFFTATQQEEILNFGWRSQQGLYFSGGLYQEFDFITYFPRDLAILAWEGNADYLDYPFDLSQLSATGDLLTVYHFGVNKLVNTRLTVGVRAKIYSSILNVRSTQNKGTFTTRMAETTSENIYEHRIADADVTIQTSGIASLEDNSSVGKFIGRAFFGGNLGLGFDLGATYDINERWTVSGSLLDLGAIVHAKDVETYHAYGDYVLDGIELLFPPLAEGAPTYPYYEDLENELEEQIPVDTLSTTYVQARPIKFNAGLLYRFGRIAQGSKSCDCLNQGGAVEREQSVGVQFYSIYRPKGPLTAVTLFYHRRLFNFLSVKTTYTLDSYSFSNVGLGMAADLGKFNAYFAVDNILDYGNLAKAKSVSLQLGLNIKMFEE